MGNESINAARCTWMNGCLRACNSATCFMEQWLTYGCTCKILVLLPFAWHTTHTLSTQHLLLLNCQKNTSTTYSTIIPLWSVAAVVDSSDCRDRNCPVLCRLALHTVPVGLSFWCKRCALQPPCNLRLAGEETQSMRSASQQWLYELESRATA